MPRFPLAATPTPLEECPRLAGAIGVDRLMIKRDDLTGLAFGGNKVRELEYFVGAALAAGADTFVAGGGAAQSNHARQCAAAARRAGLDVHLVLRHGLAGNEDTGNRLITTLLTDSIEWVDDDPGLEDRERLSQVMDDRAAALIRSGRRPWVLHSSFHPLGAAGYVAAGVELADQLAAVGIGPATIAVTSMGATRVGLQIAATVLGLEWTIVGLGWRPLEPGLAERLDRLHAETVSLLALGDHDLKAAADDSYATTIDAGGPAYGVPSEAGLDALRLCARSEGLLLDPVYTAKGFAGMASAVGGLVDPSTPLVFVHTGGVPALFAYPHDLISKGGDP